jgi:hypothetical protein
MGLSAGAACSEPLRRTRSPVTSISSCSGRVDWRAAVCHLVPKVKCRCSCTASIFKRQSDVPGLMMGDLNPTYKARPSVLSMMFTVPTSGSISSYQSWHLEYLADLTQKYKVHRKIAIGRHERVLAIDGDYIHVSPGYPQSRPASAWQYSQAEYHR